MKDNLVERVYDAIERHIPNDRVEAGDVRDAAIDAIRVIVEECAKVCEARYLGGNADLETRACVEEIRKLAGGDNG